MRILSLHNSYLQPGGEDRIFEDEAALLREHGHQVLMVQRHNRELQAKGRLRAGLATVWSRSGYQQVSALIRDFQPDLVHCHNLFPLISPAAYYAARAWRRPVVQTLHNFRLLCAASSLWRNHGPCRQCLGRAVGWPGIIHACYRGSRTASAAVVAMQSLHRWLGSWRKLVARYICPSRQLRQIFLEAGFQSSQLVVKPNLIRTDPGAGTGQGGYALFVGRLTTEKGVGQLLRAQLTARLPLKVIGDGPLRPQVLATPGVEYLGQQSHEQVLHWMRQAHFLVVPSLAPESFGLVAAEALACATPVLAARSGNLSELVTDGHTGHLYEPGDHQALARLLREFVATQDMRLAARRWFLDNLSRPANYRQLMDIYGAVLP
ncbi:MAG: glycosyltransferase [Vulcanimicrobiota bacterium]